MLGKFQEDNKNNLPNEFDLFLGFLQIYDLLLNLNQTSNDAIMQHLLKQDEVLDNQTNELQKQTNIYLKKIIEQNIEIISQNKEIKNLLQNMSK